jgi:hypothetical protein
MAATNDFLSHDRLESSTLLKGSADLFENSSTHFSEWIREHTSLRGSASLTGVLSSKNEIKVNVSFSLARPNAESPSSKPE